jgi:hypothetical protein
MNRINNYEMKYLIKKMLDKDAKERIKIDKIGYIYKIL